MCSGSVDLQLVCVIWLSVREKVFVCSTDIRGYITDTTCHHLQIPGRRHEEQYVMTVFW